MDRASIFRVISFTLAGGDIFQTIPGTYRLYKKQWKARSISPICFLYAMVRYLTIISLVSNGVGFFGKTFTDKTCKPFYMLPNVTAMLAGMAVQGIIYIRTCAISGRDVWVTRLLGLLLLLNLPVQVFGIVYHRDPSVINGNCKGKVLVPGEPDWNIVYYLAHMVFDWVACCTATFWLVWASRSHNTFNIPKFMQRVLRQGLLYTVAVSFANLWVVLEFTAVITTGVGATLPLAVVLISAQHLVLGTQRPHSDHPSSSEALSAARDRSRSFGLNSSRMPGFPAFAHGSSRNLTDIELQSSGIYVLNETYAHTSSPDTPRSAVKFDAQRHPYYDATPQHKTV
ncbi:hypothetical protein BDZ89DRAFT_1059717 [Hymenopellis radicata]|nr:hypothetical protein BDZ89DRAFT_1059717 [Hymenopellis radicata]